MTGRRYGKEITSSGSVTKGALVLIGRDKLAQQIEVCHQ